VNVLLAMSPIQDGMNRVIGVLCLATDLTERTQLYRAERDQMFLATLISSAEDAIFSEDPNGIVTSWNPGAERMFGYTSDEIVGRAISRLIPPNPPDLESQLLERLRRDDRSAAGEERAQQICPEAA
jgi:PAS domain-containing protein